MAERDQRTEEATPRKREQMRQEGQVAQSHDVGSAAVVVASFATLAWTGTTLVRGLSNFALRSLRLVDASRPLDALRASVKALLPAALPIIAAAVAAIVVGVVQARTFSFSVIAFKLERLDPTERLSQMLPGKHALIEILKQVVKLLAIGWLVYQLIAQAMPMFSALAASSPMVAASSVAGVAQKLAMRVGLAFVAVAGFDYWLAHRKFSEDAKMSRDEVRDEHKAEEGRPEIREKIRRKMRELAKNRALSDVSKATVMVVNPTHYAVALRYLPERDAAPIVLAKGKDELALSMRAQARRHQVPMLENKPLARALYSTSKIGRPIPVDLYRAVAEVIAYVMQLRARKGGTTLVRAPQAPRGES